MGYKQNFFVSGIPSEFNGFCCYQVYWSECLSHVFIESSNEQGHTRFSLFYNQNKEEKQILWKKPNFVMKYNFFSLFQTQLGSRGSLDSVASLEYKQKRDGEIIMHLSN